MSRFHLDGEEGMMGTVTPWMDRAERERAMMPVREAVRRVIVWVRGKWLIAQRWLVGSVVMS